MTGLCIAKFEYLNVYLCNNTLKVLFCCVMYNSLLNSAASFIYDFVSCITAHPVYSLCYSARHPVYTWCAVMVVASCITAQHVY